MLSITLETLSTGKVRVTGRQDGRTVYAEWCQDDSPAEKKRMCLDALNKVAFAHKRRDGSFDFTYITVNEAAKQALEA